MTELYQSVGEEEGTVPPLRKQWFLVATQEGRQAEATAESVECQMW